MKSSPRMEHIERECAEVKVHVQTQLPSMFNRFNAMAEDPVASTHRRSVVDIYDAAYKYGAERDSGAAHEFACYCVMVIVGAMVR